MQRIPPREVLCRDLAPNSFLLLLLALVHEFLRDCFLYFLGVNAIPFRSAEKNVLRILGRQTICRIEQAQFQQKTA